ncbi:MAG: DUF4286 family protein, partial [bacterium]
MCPESPVVVLLLTSVDVDPVAAESFNHWYNDVHIPDVMACPGFVSVRRFEAVYGEPRYIALYELESEEALATPEMQRVRGWGDMF